MISRRCPLALAVVLATLVSAARAQQPPHVGYVYPAGGRQGTQFKVTLGGRFLDGVDKCYVSGPGVKAGCWSTSGRCRKRSSTTCREKLQELQKRRPYDAATQREIARIRQKLASFIRAAAQSGHRRDGDGGRHAGRRRPARHPRAAADTPPGPDQSAVVLRGPVVRVHRVAGQGRPRRPAREEGGPLPPGAGSRSRPAHRDHPAGHAQRPDHARHRRTAIASAAARGSNWWWPPAPGS